MYKLCFYNCPVVKTKSDNLIYKYVHEYIHI